MHGDEDDEEEKCLEMKEGEKVRDLKCLQVDCKYRNVLRGRQDRVCSKSSSGSLLHRFGSIF